MCISAPLRAVSLSASRVFCLLGLLPEDQPIDASHYDDGNSCFKQLRGAVEIES